MPIELKMPALSPTMEEGTLAKWLVKEGDTVKSGDILAEIETDKATMEYEAIDEGTVAQIMVAEGSDGVKVGTVIATLLEEGEEAGAAPAPKAKVGSVEIPKAEAEATATAEAKPTASTEEKAAAAPASAASPPAEEKGYGADPAAAAAAKSGPAAKSEPEAAAPASGAGEGRVVASPLAKRIAEQQGLDLGSVTGSGPHGRIVKADLDGAKAATAKPAADAAKAEAASAPKPAPAAAPAKPAAGGELSRTPYETVKLSGMRKTIARRLTESKQQVPHIYLTVDCKLDALLKLRTDLNKALEKRGVKVSVNDMLVKALGMSLVEVPACNVSFAGDNLLKFARADISVAVSIPGGLITPIVEGAEGKSFSAIATEMKDLAARAKDGKLKPDEYQGGTASLSNMGMFGIKSFDAVINPPQAMILAIGAGEARPYVVDGKVDVATIMSVTGSFDHRAIDGADGAQLMAAFKRLVESPLGMVA